MTKKKTVHIEGVDLGIEWQDAGPWRNYEIQAHGSTYAELIEDATISEIDQDGGELNCYGINDASTSVALAAQKVIERECKKAGIKVGSR